MKKLGILTMLSLALTLGLTACGGDPVQPSQKSSQTTQDSSIVEQSSSATSSIQETSSSSMAASSSNQTTSSAQKSSSSEQKSSSSQASSISSSVSSSSSKESSSSQASSSSQESSSIHVHVYGNLIEEVLPSWSYDGMKAHYRCSECKQYFDVNKNPVTEQSLKLPRASENIAVSVNGIQKGVFTFTAKDNAEGPTWEYKNLVVAVGDVITITKPGDATYRYSYFGNGNVDKDGKILTAGTVNLDLSANANGFHLEVSGYKYPGLVVTVNDDEYPLNKVTYLEDDKETYIYGYHYFNVGDKMTVVDKVNSVTYDFDDLEDDVLWNVYDFEKGTNNEIVFKKQARFGIEFDRGGDKKISITKTFEPSRTFEHCVLAFLDGRENEVMTETTYASTSLEYEAFTWYLTHEKVINNQDIVDFLSINGLTIYFKSITLHVGERFIVTGFPSEFGVFFDNLVDLRVDEGAISQDGDYIKIMKEGTYEVGYVPCCNSLYIYSSHETNDAYVMVGGNSYPLTKDADNNVTYTAHFEKNQYAVFMDSSYQPITPNQVGISMGTPAHASSFMIYFDKAGTFTLTLNLDTKNLNVDAVSIDPEDQPSEITSARLVGSGNLNTAMVDNPNNADELMKENVAMVASNDMIYVMVYRGDFSGAIDGVTLSPSSADIAMSYSSLFYITAGEGTYSFYLNKKSLVLTIVKVS